MSRRPLSLRRHGEQGLSFDPLYVAANGAVVWDGVVVMWVPSVAELLEAQVSGVNLWQPAPVGEYVDL